MTDRLPGYIIQALWRSSVRHDSPYQDAGLGFGRMVEDAVLAHLSFIKWAPAGFKVVPTTEEEPVFHLRSYGDVTEEELERLTSAQPQEQSEEQDLRDSVTRSVLAVNEWLMSDCKSEPPRTSIALLREVSIAAITKEARKPLTDEDIDRIANSVFDGYMRDKNDDFDRAFARAIEAAHGIRL